jgi:hypothetical protein
MTDYTEIELDGAQCMKYHLIHTTIQELALIAPSDDSFDR